MAPTTEPDRQLPLGEEIFLDHVGHFVRDPDAASRALARAGFAPTPLSIQSEPAAEGGTRPTGTGNVCAMLSRGYMEVLFKTADTPLGRELEAGLARYCGVHLAALAVADAAAAHRRLGGAGFRVRPLAQMRRPVDTETGKGEVAFTIARVEAGVMPEGRMQILTHRTPGNLWQPRWLSHPNGALGLTRLIIAVADADEAVRRFARFTGRAAMRDGHAIALDRGRIEFMTPKAFNEFLPDVEIPDLPFCGAYGIAVSSLDKIATLFRAGGLSVRRDGARMSALFPTELGTGAWIFSERDAAV